MTGCHHCIVGDTVHRVSRAPAYGRGWHIFGGEPPCPQNGNLQRRSLTSGSVLWTGRGFFERETVHWQMKEHWWSVKFWHALPLHPEKSFDVFPPKKKILFGYNQNKNRNIRHIFGEPFKKITLYLPLFSHSMLYKVFLSDQITHHSHDM